MYLVVIKLCNNNICAVIIIRQLVATWYRVGVFKHVTLYLTRRQTKTSVLCP